MTDHVIDYGQGNGPIWIDPNYWRPDNEGQYYYQTFPYTTTGGELTVSTPQAFSDVEPAEDLMYQLVDKTGTLVMVEKMTQVLAILEKGEPTLIDVFAWDEENKQYKHATRLMNVSVKPMCKDHPSYGGIVEYGDKQSGCTIKTDGAGWLSF